MRHPDLDLMMVMERRQDDLRAAEHARLLKEARRAAAPRPTLRFAALALARSLAYLGGHMLNWSERLQCRYRLLATGAENQASPC